MAEKIRLGNDIGVRWSLIDENEQPYIFDGRDVSVEIDIGGKKRYRVKELTHEANTLIFTYWGMDQKYTGACSLKFIENDGEKEMVTFDIPNAFELVAHSWLTGGSPENERVQLSFVTITSNLTERIGPKGDPAGFGEIQATVDALVGTPSVEVITSGPDTAKNITFAFHNLKGEPGDIESLTSAAIVNALGYTPADDAEVIKQLKTIGGQEIEGDGEIVKNIVFPDDGSSIAFQKLGGSSVAYFTALIIAAEGYAIVNYTYTSHKVYDYGGIIDKFFYSSAANAVVVKVDHQMAKVFMINDSGLNRIFGTIDAIPVAVDWESDIYRYYQKPSTGIPASDIANDAIKSFAGVPIKGSGDVMVRVARGNRDGGFIIKNALYRTCKLLIVPEHYRGFAYFNGGANMSMVVIDNNPSQFFIVQADDIRDVYFAFEGASYNILLLEGTMPQIEVPAERPAVGSALTAQVIRDTSSFITKSVNNLTNYYLKSETYTKAEVATQIANALTGAFVSTNRLPSASANTMGKIYLVPSSDPQTENVKDEYITIAGGLAVSPTYSWEKIGTTAVSLDGVVKFDESQSLTDAQQTQARANIGAGTYSKPSNGIPASDLANGVIPTVPDEASNSEIDALFV